MDHSNKNSSGSESNASVICKGYSFSNLAEPVQIHRETYTRTATIQTPVTGDTNGMTRQSVRKPHMNDHHLHRRCFKIDRVGGGITPAVLSTTVRAVPHTAVHVNSGTASTVPAVISDPAS